MKAFFISQPYQWSIDLKGESWEQGSLIEGEIEVKSLQLGSQVPQKSKLQLCFGDIKKVHQRDLKSLKIVQEIELSHISSLPFIFPFSFKLENNSPVMDKKSSFFILYGEEQKENHLLIPTKPNGIYLKISQLLETFYRFKLKDIKNGKKHLEFKYIPPTSREYAGCEALNFEFNYQETEIEINILAEKKVLDTSSVTTKLSKEEIKKTLRLNHKKLNLGKGMIDQDYVLKELKMVLDEIKMKDIF